MHDFRPIVFVSMSIRPIDIEKQQNGMNGKHTHKYVECWCEMIDFYHIHCWIVYTIMKMFHTIVSCGMTKNKKKKNEMVSEFENK